MSVWSTVPKALPVHDAHSLRSTIVMEVYREDLDLLWPRLFRRRT